MNKLIKKTTDKLRSRPIFTLSREEVYKYFSYRLDKLLQKKCIITRGELEYLFGETGSGFFRIDPEILSALTNEKHFVYKIIALLKDDHEYSTTIKNALDEKLKIENTIKNSCKQLERGNGIKNILGCYIDNIEFDAQKNVFLGDCHNIPVCAIFGNGEWLLPKQDIINFLTIAKERKALPIFIYKKIYGGLFPLFKQVSALGLNTHVIFVDHNTFTQYKKFNKNYEFNKKQIDRRIGEFPFLLENIAYNDQIYDATIALKDSKKRQEVHFQNLFENIVPKLGEKFREDFLKSELNLDGSFSDLLDSIKIKKLRMNLLENYNAREDLIRDIAYLSPAGR